MDKQTLDWLTDEDVRKAQEEWQPDQYNDWEEPARSAMKSIAEKFYTMSVKDYREVLLNSETSD